MELSQQFFIFIYVLISGVAEKPASTLASSSPRTFVLGFVFASFVVPRGAAFLALWAAGLGGGRFHRYALPYVPHTSIIKKRLLEQAD